MNVASSGGEAVIRSQVVAAMHKIREYGNHAAHGRARELPKRSECERAVRVYLTLKRHRQGKPSG